MVSPLMTLRAEKTLWSHRTGLMANVSVLPGVAPAVPSATLYQAGTCATWVVLEVLSPHTVVVPGTTIVCCNPRTVADDAVCTDPVSVHDVAPAAVNGDPVAEDSVASECRPHSVIANDDV